MSYYFYWVGSLSVAWGSALYRVSAMEELAVIITSAAAAITATVKSSECAVELQIKFLRPACFLL